jgi:RNA polymerase sigma factor (sigma-70 family)
MPRQSFFMDMTSLSLLGRARTGSGNDWDRLVAVYQPLISGWLRRQGLPHHAIEELTQDVLLTVFRELGSFAHPGKPGAFRGWLRVITVNRARAYWRADKVRPAAMGGSDFHSILEQLEDPESELSRQWDQDHDRHVITRLLELLEGEFTPGTLRAFRRHVFDGAAAEAVATELDMTVGAVYVAKSRVLARLRKEAEGLLADESLP